MKSDRKAQVQELYAWAADSCGNFQIGSRTIQMVRQAADRLAVLNAIVSDLAECADPRDYSRDGCCALCHNTTEHTDSCPWARAQAER